MAKPTLLQTVTKNYDFLSVVAFIFWLAIDWFFNISDNFINSNNEDYHFIPVSLYIAFVALFFDISLEDYKTGYIDIRKCGILLSICLFLQADKITFLTDYFIGLFLFFVLFLSQIRYIRIKVWDQLIEMQNLNRYTSFIPSFWLGVLIALPLLSFNVFGLGNLRMYGITIIHLFTYLLEDNLMWIFVFCLSVILYAAKQVKRFYERTGNGYEAIYGIGLGDVFLLPIFIGALGWDKFLLVFFISNILHIILYFFSKYING